MTRRAQGVRVAALTALGLVILLLLLRRVHLSPAGVLAAVTHAATGWVLLAFAGSLGTLATRSFRFHVFFPEVTFAAFLPVTALYNALAVVLPGGLGEAFFALYLRRRIGRGLIDIGGRLLVTRLMDLVTLMGILALSGLVPGAHLWARIPPVLGVGLWAMLLVALGLLGLIWRGGRPGRGLRLPRRMVEGVERAREGMQARVLTPSLVVTLVNRIIGIVGYWGLFQALSLPLNLWEAAAAYAFVNLCLAIPVQGVLGAGSVDLWWVLALSALGVAARMATTSAVAIHVWLLVFALLPGVVAGLVLILRGSGGILRPDRETTPA